MYLNRVRKVFGEKISGVLYHDRVGAYAIIISNRKIVVTRTRGGKIFLPGGKIEQDETEIECIERECMEELGMRVVVKELIAIGERYFYLESNNMYSHPIAHFYYCDEYEKVSDPLEDGGEYMWMTFEEAMEQLYHPHHRWAVKLVCEKQEETC